MSKLLVVDSDAVSGILTVDQLRGDGFAVVLHDSADQVPSRAMEEYADAVLVAMTPASSAFEILAELRKDPRTESLPIMMLLGGEAETGTDASTTASGTNKVAAKPVNDGVRALREGANHYLTRPCDPEELTLTLSRLVSTRSPGRSLLEGDLSCYPIWELLQFLNQGDKSGRLTLALRRKPADLTLRSGQLVEARFGKLRQGEAILSMLLLEEGHFRFVPASLPGQEVVGRGPDVKTLLMEAAWLRDELEARKDHLPDRGARLHALMTVVPPLHGPVRGLPIQEVFEQIRDRSEATLVSMSRNMEMAPQRIELALLLLLEAGAVARVSEVAPQQPVTSEIDAGLLLDLAVDGLLSSANVGNDGTLRLLLLAEEDSWQSLVRIFTTTPSGNDKAAWLSLADQLERWGGGSTAIRRPKGTLSVLVQLLSASVQPRVESILPLCHGVGIWLSHDDSGSAVPRIVKRLDQGPGPSTTLLIADAASAEERARKLASGQVKRWICPAAPRSLVAVLQLFERGAQADG